MNGICFKIRRCDADEFVFDKKELAVRCGIQPAFSSRFLIQSGPRIGIYEERNHRRQTMLPQSLEK